MTIHIEDLIEQIDINIDIRLDIFQQWQKDSETWEFKQIEENTSFLQVLLKFKRLIEQNNIHYNTWGLNSEEKETLTWLFEEIKRYN